MSNDLTGSRIKVVVFQLLLPSGLEAKVLFRVIVEGFGFFLCFLGGGGGMTSTHILEKKIIIITTTTRLLI